MESQQKPGPDWYRIGALEFTETACPVCKAERGRELYNRIIAGHQMRFWICGSCGNLYVKNPVAASSLRQLFGSKDFYESNDPGGDRIDYFDFIGGERYLRRTARSRIAHIAEVKSTGKLLEVASAAGFFLIEAKNAGYDCEGIEISEPMAKYASERWGVPVKGASIELVDLRTEHYDVIASWGVMTILRDPIAVVRKFHRALKGGGVWALNTYYHDSLWHRIMGGRWSILGVQTSQVFSKQQMLDIVRQEGFELVARRRDWPATDLLKIADQLALNTNWKWLVTAVQKSGLSKVMVRVPLPDVYEYLWRKV